MSAGTPAYPSELVEAAEPGAIDQEPLQPLDEAWQILESVLAGNEETEEQMTRAQILLRQCIKGIDPASSPGTEYWEARIALDCFPIFQAWASNQPAPSEDILLVRDNLARSIYDATDGTCEITHENLLKQDKNKLRLILTLGMMARHGSNDTVGVPSPPHTQFDQSGFYHILANTPHNNLVPVRVLPTAFERPQTPGVLTLGIGQVAQEATHYYEPLDRMSRAAGPLNAAQRLMTDYLADLLVAESNGDPLDDSVNSVTDAENREYMDRVSYEIARLATELIPVNTVEAPSQTGLADPVTEGLTILDNVLLNRPEDYEEQLARAREILGNYTKGVDPFIHPGKDYINAKMALNTLAVYRAWASGIPISEEKAFQVERSLARTIKDVTGETFDIYDSSILDGVETGRLRVALVLGMMARLGSNDHIGLPSTMKSKSAQQSAFDIVANTHLGTLVDVRVLSTTFGIDMNKYIGALNIGIGQLLHESALRIPGFKLVTSEAGHVVHAQKHLTVTAARLLSRETTKGQSLGDPDLVTSYDDNLKLLDRTSKRIAELCVGYARGKLAADQGGK